MAKEFTDEQLQALWYEEQLAEQRANDRMEDDELRNEYESFNWNL